MIKPIFLLVFNDADFLNKIGLFFQAKCLECHFAKSGNEAIDILDFKKIDIIISAYQMQSGNGMKLLEYSRSKIHPPLFYFYDNYQNEIVIDSLRAGALDFFNKSKSFDEILLEIINDFEVKKNKTN